MLSLLARLCAVAAAVVLLAPAGASAKVIEMGQTTATPGEPDCPGVSAEDPCNAVSRTTAYQVNDGTQKDVFLAPRDGRIVAWTIGLSDPATREVDFFEANFGGEARAGISVLRQQEKGSTANEVVANSAVRKLTPYFGRRVQFPLVETLPIERGDRVALTVPTWAPAFIDGLDGKTAWRASRTNEEEGDCGSTESLAMQTALLSVGAAARFQCFYKTARIAYSVTLITEPKVKKKKKRDKPAAEESSSKRVHAAGA